MRAQLLAKKELARTLSNLPVTSSVSGKQPTKHFAATIRATSYAKRAIISRLRGLSPWDRWQFSRLYTAASAMRLDPVQFKSSVAI